MENDGLTVDLTGIAQTNIPTVTYQWDFGDGNSANGKSQQHTFTDLGVYNICLNIKADTCELEICKEVDLSDSCLLLQSEFTAQVNSNERTVEFTNQSSGEYSYILWGFGDGNTSTEMNPEHTYSQDGIYNVCLVLRDEATGCSDYHCFEVEVGNVSAPQIRKQKEWVLYPNPITNGQNSFYLQRRQQQYLGSISSIHIVDLYGKVVYQRDLDQVGMQDLINIDLRNQLPAGTYYVKAITGKNIEVHKLIVQ